MKKVNLYMIFTNKMIKLNEKKIYFMLKIISSLVQNQSKIKEQQFLTTFLIARFGKVVLNQQFERRVG